MPDLLFEVCVDTLEGLLAADRAGVDRIELCSALSLGGLTPSLGLIRCAARIDRPVRVMIRPRAGNFVFTEDELEECCQDIAAVREAGLDGVVLGAATTESRLDLAALSRLREAAGPMGATLHRVVDTLPDPVAAVADAIALGFDTVLSSGGARTAPEGVRVLAAMQQAAGTDLTIMAGSGVTVTNLGAVVGSGVGAVHASCSGSRQEDPRLVTMGFAPPEDRFTDTACIDEMVAALRQMAGAEAGAGLTPL
jgi:copper homeostasis protein